MSFKPLSERLESLPLVLAGPILRRVDPARVSVFVALRKKSKVTLRVFDPLIAAPNDEVAIASADTVPLGKNLHVVVVSAELFAALAPGKLYTYNLYFGEDVGHLAITEPNLKDSGILIANNPAVPAPIDLLHYREPPNDEAPDLPSFVTSPVKVTDLCIVHASCRKPHGEGLEMLHQLDKRIQENNPRPHRLFLTGDQIYADDVADPLLFLLKDASSALLGWGEALPTIDDGTSLTFTQEAAIAEAMGKGLSALPIEQAAVQARLIPGKRQVLSDYFAKFSSEHAASHLFSLGEFFTMYLFAWSDVLWPDLSSEDSLLLSDMTGYISEGVSGSEETYKTQRSALKGFLATLKQVRRALANVPVSMIYDDHEITDDWFAHLRWTQDVLRSPLGKRVMLNGMAAYAIFQHWGNTPEQFAAGQPGGELLSLLESENGAPPALYGDPEAIHTLFGIPYPGALYNDADGTMEPPLPAKAFKYHYSVDGPPNAAGKPEYRFYVLNTRTRRRFPIERDVLNALWMAPRKNPPELISEAALNEQMPADGAPCPLIFVIVPSPVRGLERAEEWQSVGAFLGFELFSDYEAWSLQPRAVERLMARIAELAASGPNNAKRANAIILNGDVHYAFASRLSYQLKTDQSVTSAVVAHFTASSLHNQTDEFPSTIKVHNQGYGWWDNDREPELIQVPSKEFCIKAEYVANHGIIGEGTPRGGIPPEEFPHRKYQQEAAKHWTMVRDNSGTETVGYNNIGVVRVIEKPGASQLDAEQELVWTKDAKDNPRSTLYSVPLVFNAFACDD